MRELGSLSVQRHQEIGAYVASLSPQPDLLITVGDEAKDIAIHAQKSGLSVQTCQTAEDAAVFVQETVHNFDGQQLVLVKGSRGVRLEVVTQSLSRD
jgi:UDP-N-acetylmuramoyl-tripeptide--D-alanyl-D-alanine ligase